MPHELEVPEVPIVPPQDPGQTPIPLRRVGNPYDGVAFISQTVSDVPENVMGWLIAQGWEITGVTRVPGSTPPTNYFALKREGTSARRALLDLCNTYTDAANDARGATQQRYHEVIANWTTMVETSHKQFNAQTAQQNAQAGIFFTDLEEYMTAINTLIANNQTQLGFDAAEAKIVLVRMDLRLTELEDNAADNAIIIANLLTEQETNLQAYITDYDTRLAELQSNVTDHITTVLNKVSSLGTVLETHVADYTLQFDSLLANYNFHVADIDALLANVADNVNTYVTDVAAILTLLDSDYETVSTDLGVIRTTAGTLVSTHVLDYNAVLTLLSSDYTTQASTTRAIVNFLYFDFQANATVTRGITDFLASDYQLHGPIVTSFLDDLGTTDRARINEEFAARLATQLQQLTTRGLSTSTLITDITERNQRDRDEQIQLLNDRLMREKFENQHKLYDQQRVMRTQTLENEHRLYEQQRAMHSQRIDAEGRLYEQQVGMRTRTLDGKNQMHTVQQEVLKYQASLISGVYALLQETRNRVLAGKQAIFAANDANKRLGIEVQTRLYGQLQDVRQKIIESTDRIYQLRDVYAKWDDAEEHKLYEQLQQVKQQFVEAVEKQHTAKQTVTRAEMSQRDILLQQLQTALLGLLSGKERFSSLLTQNSNALAEHKHKAITERMETAVKRLAGWQSVAEENRKLLAYQLDERNKLLIGLYGFVERRDDEGPSWKDSAGIVSALGDSAGGWIQP